MQKFWEKLDFMWQNLDFCNEFASFSWFSFEMSKKTLILSMAVLCLPFYLLPWLQKWRYCYKIEWQSSTVEWSFITYNEIFFPNLSWCFIYLSSHATQPIKKLRSMFNSCNLIFFFRNKPVKMVISNFHLDLFQAAGPSTAWELRFAPGWSRDPPSTTLTPPSSGWPEPTSPCLTHTAWKLRRYPSLPS